MQKPFHQKKKKKTDAKRIKRSKKHNRNMKDPPPLFVCECESGA